MLEKVDGKSSGVPRLRFPGFLEAWKQIRLGDAAQIYQPRTISQSDLLKDGEYTVYGANGIIGKYDEYNHEYPQVTVTCRGNTCGVVNFTEPFSWITGNSMVINVDKNSQIDKGFLFHYLQNDNLQYLVTGSGQPQITGEIKKHKIYLPSVIEQEKIGSFLNTVDVLIENLHRQKIELTSYRKGAIQKIFSREIRFSRGNDSFPEWGLRRLGDVLDYEQPTRYIVRSTNYHESIGTPVLTAGKTFILGYTDEGDNIFDTNKLPVIIFDDFTTAIQFVTFPFKIKSSAMKILLAKDGADAKYIYEAMKMIRYEVGGHGRHWISQFSNIRIPFPSYSEQQKIGEFLTSLDNVIDSTQKKIDLAEQWKKGLSQQLFISTI